MGRSKSSPLRVVSFAANLLVVGAIVTALYVAQDVFIPIALATMLGFLLAPLADRLENRGLGRIPSVIVLVFLAVGIIGSLLWVVGREATKLADNLPKYQHEIVDKLENFATVGSGTSRKLSHFVQVVSGALRGERQVDQTASDAPLDDLDPASAQAVRAEASEKDIPGSESNPIHTVQRSSETSPVDTALGTVTAILTPLTNVGLVLVFTIFILLSRDDLRDRFIRLLSGGRYIVTTKAIDEASRRISSYILAQTIVNSIYGVCIGVGLWIIGLTLGGQQGFPNFALWGLLCAILRFIPYLGPIIAGAFPIALSLIVFPGFSVFLATAALFTAIELGSNNILEPWLYGSSTGMSAMAVIIAAVFWTWMWGPVGLLLAVPLTASLVVMGKYVPQLRPITVLLGDRAPLPPHVSFYQRLLADDQPRAAKMLESAIAEGDLVTATDEILLPTIRRVRRDRASEELSAPREHRLMQLITGMIDDVLLNLCRQTDAPLAVPELATVTTSGATGEDLTGMSAVFDSRATESGVSASECAQRVAKTIGDVQLAEELDLSQTIDGCEVFGCTAHHESEEPVLKLLSWCLSQRDIAMRWTGTKALPSDVETWVEAQQPPVIVISIVPPEGFVQARYLCRRLHASSPASQIIIAYFGKLRAYDSMLVKFRAVGASFFATSLTQTTTQVVGALQRTSRLKNRPA